ncbi:PD-(D/E)XK nuclease family protein [Thiolapillus brandeum]|nr:PD-(D/E)XK nuclease family protein [Thiolapillus brandeum]
MERRELMDHMARGALVLTGNARLSRSLLAEYENSKMAEGAAAWATPSVLPWQSWLQQCWEETVLASPGELPQVLDDAQARWLWKQVLDRDPQAGLLSHNALIRQLQKSWRLLHDWCLDPDQEDFGQSADSAAFQKLARGFVRECRAGAGITEAEMPGVLAEYLADADIRLPGEILLLGFSVLTPAQGHLLEVLKALGVDARRVRLKGRQGQARLCQLADPRQELEMAAAWARGLLLDQPELSLGIVIPDLQNRYQEVVHCMNKALEPKALLPGCRPSHSAWNISLGRPLAEYAPVTAAMGLLSLMRGTLSLEQVETLMRSPYVAGGRDETVSRGWLVYRLRDTGRDRFGLGSLLYQARMCHGDTGEPRPWYCEALGKALAELAELRKENGSGPRKPSAWVEIFSTWLEAAGWMAGISLDSVEYQVVERWKRVLSSFRSLDRVAQELSIGDALDELRRMARDTVFQPRYPSAPLQVLGLFEVTELAFDKLWVMGMHETAWPSAPDPDPFIPLSLQQALHMPGADANRELQLAREMLDGLQGAAGEVLFSHALMDGAEELQPSPLLDHCARVAVETLGLEPLTQWETQMLSRPVMEETRDQGLPVADRVQGGASLFRHQSQCPFRAFAEHRLGARSYPGVHAGLDAAQRGSLLHQALDIFWEQTGDQHHLLNLDAAALQQRIRVSVSAALGVFEGHQPGLLGARGRDIEARRLQELLTRWMEEEKARAGFRVLAREERFEGRIRHIDYRLFVDRIDELEDGRLVLMDYKTGRVTPSDWFGERPDDPQLPLYSTVLDTDRVAAVVFARLRPDTLGFSGVVATDALLPGLPPRRGSSAVRQASEEWPQVLHQWRETVDGLAAEFSEGRADVAPRDGSATCEQSYCELMALCRLHSQEQEDIPE